MVFILQTPASTQILQSGMMIGMKWRFSDKKDVNGQSPLEY